jgi:hypothetical protein
MNDTLKVTALLFWPKTFLRRSVRLAAGISLASLLSVSLFAQYGRTMGSGGMGTSGTMGSGGTKGTGQSRMAGHRLRAMVRGKRLELVLVPGQQV